MKLKEVCFDNRGKWHMVLALASSGLTETDIKKPVGVILVVQLRTGKTMLISE